MKTIIEEVRRALKESIDSKTLAGSGRYFKSGEAAKVYGVRMCEVDRIAKESFCLINALSKQEIFALCDELWKPGYLEEAVIACTWAEALHNQYEPEDFKIFERWVHDCLTNWADCDTLCNHTVGTFIMMYPEYISGLKR